MAGISKEVKDEVIEKVKGGERVAELSENYRISTKTIYYWLRKKSEGAISVIEYNRLKRENRELKEIIGALTVQLEKEKKKTAR